MKAWVNIHKLKIAYLFAIWIPKCLLGNSILSWIYVCLLLLNLKPQWIYAKTSVDKQPQKYEKKHISSLFARKYRDSPKIKKKTYQISKHCRFRVWRESGEKFQFFFINEKPSTKFKFFFTSPEWCWLVPTFHLCYEKWMFRLRVIKLVLMVFFLEHLNLLLLWLFAAGAGAASQTSIYCYIKWTLEIVLIPFPFFSSSYLLLILYICTAHTLAQAINVTCHLCIETCAYLAGKTCVHVVEKWVQIKKAETMNFSLCSNK